MATLLAQHRKHQPKNHSTSNSSIKLISKPRTM